MWKTLSALAGLTFVLMACGEGNESEINNETTGNNENQEDIALDVEAEVVSGGLEVTIILENRTDQEETLTFMSGHQFDLTIYQSGELVYDYAEGMMFTQAIIEQTLAPGEELIFTETWEDYDENMDEITIQVEVLADELDEKSASESTTYP